jgi:hypothetical protein
MLPLAALAPPAAAGAPAAGPAAPAPESTSARRWRIGKGLVLVGIPAIETVTFTTLAWQRRDEPNGRRLAVLAAAGAGATLGAAAGAWLGRGGAHPRLVTWTAAGLGLVAGGTLGWLATDEPGWSRPITTAAGMTTVLAVMTWKYWPF